MTTNRIIALTLSIFAVRALCLSAMADENISMDKVPAAAASAIKAAAGGGEINNVSVDNEDGKMNGYEAAFTLYGQKHEVSVIAEGTTGGLEAADLPHLCDRFWRKIRPVRIPPIAASASPSLRNSRATSEPNCKWI